MGLVFRLTSVAAVAAAALAVTLPASAGHRLLDQDTRLVVPRAETTPLVFTVAAHGYFGSSSSAAVATGPAAADRIAITASAGRFTTGGFSIRVESVFEQRLSGRTQLCVLAAVARPAKSSAVIQAVTQPYETVLVDRAAVPRAWVLYDAAAGAVLAWGGHSSTAACAALA
jgi:hypothetical protein